MILTTKQVEDRLKSDRNLASEKLASQIDSSNCQLEILPANHLERKGKGATKIPDTVKQMLAITAITSSDTTKEFAEVFGMNQKTANDIKRGLVGNRVDEVTKPIIQARFNQEEKEVEQGWARNKGEDKKEQKEKTEDKRDTAHSLALDSLVSTLQALTPKLSAIDKPKDLAAIASSMSKVVSNVANSKKIEKEDDEKSKMPRIVIFAPVMRQESNFEVIEA